MSETSLTEKLTEGENLFACGRTEEAEKYFLAILREHGPDKEIYNDLGVIAYQRHDYERARECFMEAIRIDPLYQDALDNFLLLRQSLPGNVSFQQKDDHGQGGGSLLTPSSPSRCDPGEGASPSDSLHPLDPHVPVVNDRKAFVVEFCRGKKVLHIGCVGSGSVEERLKDKSHLHYRISLVAESLIGLDINREGLAVLHGAGFKNCLFADVEEDGIDPQWVTDTEVIVVPEVLEHLSNPGRFLTHLKNLAFKGDILISVPNALSFRTSSYVKKFTVEFVHPDHNCYFSPVTLQTLLRKHGFSIIRSAMYYWPSEDTLGREFTTILEENPHLAEGIIAIARDNRSVGTRKGSPRANTGDGEPVLCSGNGHGNKGGSPIDRHTNSCSGSISQGLNSPIPWKLYYSPGIAHHGENARRLLNLDLYSPSIHLIEPTWFFGMYFDCDYRQLEIHQGKKIINWRGADTLRMCQNREWMGIIRKTAALHVCQAKHQREQLLQLGIASIVRPMTNTPYGHITLAEFPCENTGVLVYWRAGDDRYIQALLFFEIASHCPDVTFHVVGQEDPTRFNQPGMENIVFHGYLPEEDLDLVMNQCKGTIRPWLWDGNPNIQTKMLLKGRYAAHSCKFEKVAHCRTLDEYVEWIHWLNTVTAPNTDAREWWLGNLNRFDFLQPDFLPEGENETSR